jgi:hypothetical protein
MSRRSRPPRKSKSRTPEAPRRDIAVVIPPEDSPTENLVREAREAGPSPIARAEDAELAELDAGWD